MMTHPCGSSRLDHLGRMIEERENRVAEQFEAWLGGLDCYFHLSYEGDQLLGRSEQNQVALCIICVDATPLQAGQCWCHNMSAI